MDQAIEFVDEQGRTLRLTFVRQGDRFQQQLALSCQGTEFPVLQSVEGDDQQPWPASPPMQDLSIEPRRTGAVALLVGMSGKSHWSLSVEVVKDGLEFDVACRVAGTPTGLGSCYRSEFPIDEGVIEVAAANCSIAFTTDHRQSVDGQTLTVSPADLAASGQTARWRYQVGFRA